MMRNTTILAVAIAVLAGCGGSSGTALTDAGRLASDWLVIDLRTGASEPRRSIDPADPALRDTHMAFRRIPAGTYQPGVLGAYIADSDERGGTMVSVDASWLGVFEITRMQWSRLAGTAAPTSDGSLPASISRGDLAATLSALSATGRHFSIPDEDVWEWAAAAGTGSSFAWGSSLEENDGAAYAVFDPHAKSTQPVPSAPAAVGSKQANAWGLYDMQGNLWEHVRSSTAGYQARGGCWAHPMIACRASNRLAIPYDLPHPLIGARLAWTE